MTGRPRIVILGRSVSDNSASCQLDLSRGLQVGLHIYPNWSKEAFKYVFNWAPWIEVNLFHWRTSFKRGLALFP